MKSSHVSRELPRSYEGADIEWINDTTIRCRGIQLQLTRGFHVRESTDKIITLFKDPKFVRGYIDSLDGFSVENMVEVGIWDGGSAIFFWNLLKPKKLCCIELKASAPTLTAYIDQEQAADSFRVFFEVDQADKQRISEIMQSEYSKDPLDLVVDDASHLYAPSRATFEALFPLLRPGGLYFLEDWKANLIFPRLGGGETDDYPPLHQLVHELLDLSMHQPGVISSVNCFHNFVILERGHDEIDASDFDITRVTDHPE
ncbi:MAG: class I SAM-dependent methyltransferase [Haliea sp.]